MGAAVTEDGGGWGDFLRYLAQPPAEPEQAAGETLARLYRKMLGGDLEPGPPYEHRLKLPETEEEMAAAPEGPAFSVSRTQDPIRYEIQYQAGGRGRSREKWLPERRFHRDIPWAHVGRVWDELVSACGGRSWRLARVDGPEPVTEYGPTEVAPGEPWGPVPGSPSFSGPSPAFIPFSRPMTPQELKDEGAAKVLAVFRDHGALCDPPVPPGRARRLPRHGPG